MAQPTICNYERKTIYGDFKKCYVVHLHNWRCDFLTQKAQFSTYNFMILSHIWTFQTGIFMTLSPQNQNNFWKTYSKSLWTPQYQSILTHKIAPEWIDWYIPYYLSNMFCSHQYQTISLSLTPPLQSRWSFLSLLSTLSSHSNSLGWSMHTMPSGTRSTLGLKIICGVVSTEYDMWTHIHLSNTLPWR